jgi:hypothetical protein
MIKKLKAETVSRILLSEISTVEVKQSYKNTMVLTKTLTVCHFKIGVRYQVSDRNIRR